MRIRSALWGPLVVCALLQMGGCNTGLPSASSALPGPGDVPRGPVEVPSPPAIPPAPSVTHPRNHDRLVLANGDAGVDAQILVLSADGQEADLPLILQTLEFMGTPYTLWIAKEHAGGLTPERLATGKHGFYQGVILTTGGLSALTGGSYESALTEEEWRTLHHYEANFGVRQVSWYTFPLPEYGFNTASAVNTGQTPLQASLTPAGAAVFSYLNAQHPLEIRNAYVYRARPVDASDVPLLEDPDGNALALVKTYDDGRENLALTCDGNPSLLHSEALAYGMVNWVTRGLFLGERHITLAPQVDNFFLANGTYWGGQYRLNGNDLRAFDRWQQDKRGWPLAGDLKTSLVYNGIGTQKGQYASDTLTPAASQLQGHFNWVSHTYTYQNLDGSSADDVHKTIDQNNAVAQRLQLSAYSPSVLACPDASGLENPQAMQAAYDAGVRFVVSDSSRPGQDNPSPNAGIANASQPGIVEIPCHPTNLFFNVSQPQEWVTEYNAFYRRYWGRDLTYSEIIERESDVFLRLYLLRGDCDPWLFHQANMRTYDGQHSVLSDLLDRTVEKYTSLFNLPIVSPSLAELGNRMAARTTYNAAGVVAAIVPGVSITLRADEDAVIPVTGLRGAQAENYGGQPITYVSLKAGQTLTLPLQ